MPAPELFEKRIQAKVDVAAAVRSSDRSQTPCAFFCSVALGGCTSNNEPLLLQEGFIIARRLQCASKHPSVDAAADDADGACCKLILHTSGGRLSSFADLTAGFITRLPSAMRQ